MAEYKTTLQRQQDELLDYVSSYRRQIDEYNLLFQDWVDRLPAGFVREMDTVTKFYDYEREKK